MARRLNQEAAKSVLYGGMSEIEALKMVTINPAKMLHLDKQMGSIKIGKDADVVLWNNHPLSIYARPEKTIIDGTVYFDIEKDQILRDDLAKEKNRLIQKMLEEKNTGASTQKPSFKKETHICCDTISESDNACDNNCGLYFGSKLMKSGK
jgi:adenine deaminase